MQAVALHAVLLSGGNCSLWLQRTVRVVRAELASVLGPRPYWLRISSSPPGLPEQSGGAKDYAALHGGLLGGSCGSCLQHCWSGGLFCG